MKPELSERDTEFVGSVYINGELHAAFPTARATLCLIRCQPRGEVMKDRPRCPECLRVLGCWRHDRVGAVPREWRIEPKWVAP